MGRGYGKLAAAEDGWVSQTGCHSSSIQFSKVLLSTEIMILKKGRERMLRVSGQNREISL